MKIWHPVKWDDVLKGFEKTTKGDEMRKPRVIKGKDEKVGGERAGAYWYWGCSNDEKPRIIHKVRGDFFRADFIYQEYQGEVPECPRGKTDGEKLAELLEVAEAVTDGPWAGERHLRLKDLVKELKEGS